MSNKRIAVFANKRWEADPLCSVLLDDRARPEKFKFRKKSIKNYPALRKKFDRSKPRPLDPPAQLRLSFKYKGVNVEIWCIEELMNQAEHPSSTSEKARVLSPILSALSPTDLVIAFGTAASRKDVSANGSVIIGRRVFIHDPTANKENRSEKWSPPQADAVLDSSFSAADFNELKQQEQARYAAEARFLTPPVASASPPVILLGNGMISLGVVNITNYDDYIWADHRAVESFDRSAIIGQIGSIETTHGVIRSLTESQFLYVSGIADATGLFDYQVAPRRYAQNFVAAHNAAVALSWLIPELVALM